MATISLEELQRLVELQLGKRNVHPDARLVEDLGAESADIVNLVAAAEQKYAVSIKESEMARIFTPRDLFNLVQSRAAERPSTPL